MKTFVSTLASVLLLCFALTGCEKDSKLNETKNSLKVDSTEYEISKGILEYYGSNGSGYNIDLTLYSPGITIHENQGLPDSVSGNGHTLYFEMYSSSSEKLELGDYPENNTGNAGTFDIANYIVNWDVALNPGIDLIPITTGTVKIIKNGPEYELSFSGTDINNKAITCYYKGNLKFYTIPVDKKSARQKRAGRENPFP